MVYGTPCGCGYTSKMVFCLTFGLGLLSLLCILLWFIGSVHILFGSNAKAFICDQLEHNTDYSALNDLMPKNTSLRLHPDMLR